MKSASTRRIFYRFAWCWSRVVVFNKNKMKKSQKVAFTLKPCAIYHFLPAIVASTCQFLTFASISNMFSLVTSTQTCRIWQLDCQKTINFEISLFSKICFYYNLCKKIFLCFGAQFLSKTLFQNEKLRLYIEASNIKFVTN